MAKNGPKIRFFGRFWPQNHQNWLKNRDFDAFLAKEYSRIADLRIDYGNFFRVFSDFSASDMYVPIIIFEDDLLTLASAIFGVFRSIDP